MSRFPCKLASLHTTVPPFLPPLQQEGKELCRSVTDATETNYVNFNDRTVTHLLKLPIQGINIIALKKAVCEIEYVVYDAENGEKIQSVINNFFQENKANKVKKKILNKVINK